MVVQYAAPRAGLPGRASIQRWSNAAADGRTSITVRFVGTAEGRALNRAYRGQDHATNVLTFPYPEAGRDIKGATRGGKAGDIVLCAPVIAREARAQGKPLRAHFAHLLVHGLLHLRGHDHVRRDKARAMEALEIEILRRLGFADPYRSKE